MSFFVKFSFILAFLFIFIRSVFASELKLDVDVNGQFMLRSEFREYTNFRAPRTLFLVRQRLDFKFKILPEVYLFFQPQFAKPFGQVVYRAATPTSNILQQTSGAFFDTSLSVHQAYMSYLIFPSLEFKGGRQVLSYGDELLVGAGLGWQLYGRSFDALKFVWTHPLGSVDVFGSRLAGPDLIATSPAKDASFFGIYNKWNLGEGLREVDLYGLYLADTRPVNGTTKIHTIGARLKSPLGRWNYRTEVDYQFGGIAGTDFTAFQADLEADFLTIQSAGGRFGVEGFVSSRDFNQLFAAAHKFIGVADVFGRRNISGVALKWQFRPANSLMYQMDVFRLYRTYEDAPAYWLNGLTTIGNGLATDPMDLGTELDQTIKYDVSKNVQLIANFNVLFPGPYMTPILRDKKPIYAFLEVDVNF